MTSGMEVSPETANLESNVDSTPAGLELSDSDIEKFLKSKGEKIPKSLLGESAHEAEPVESETPVKESVPEEVVPEAKPLSKEEEIQRNHTEAMYQERRMRKEEKQRREAAEARMAELEKQLESLKQKKNQEEEEHFQEEPVVVLKKTADHLKKEIDDLKKSTEESKAKEIQQAQYQQFVAHVHQLEEQFTSKTPDYVEARQYLINNRYQEYLAAGYTPQEAANFVYQDNVAISQLALSQEVNPAERIYMLAKVRGFKGSTQNTDAQIKNTKESYDRIKAGTEMSSARLPKSGVVDKEVSDFEMLSELEPGTPEFEKAFLQFKRKQMRG